MSVKKYKQNIYPRKYIHFLSYLNTRQKMCKKTGLMAVQGNLLLQLTNRQLKAQRGV